MDLEILEINFNKLRNQKTKMKTMKMALETLEIQRKNQFKVLGTLTSQMIKNLN